MKSNRVDETAEELEERIVRNGRNHRAQRIDGKQLRLMRTVMWDIETSNLDADFGILLCSSIKPVGGPVHTMRIDESPTYAKEPWNDSWLAEQIREELGESMVVVGWNHVGFDLPFLNSRLIKHGLKPLDTSTMCFVDMLWASRYRLRIHSNRLDSVIEFLGTKTQKTALLGERWVRALAGDKKALDWIVEHNIRDVESLEEVSEKLSRFVKLQYKLVK